MDQPLAGGETVPIDPEGYHNRRIKRDRKVLGLAFCISFLFVFVEIIGGRISHSLSILSDALHLLSDSAGYLIGLIGLSLSMRRPSGRFTFGYARAESLAAFLSLLMIWGMSGLLSYYGVMRFYAPRQVESGTMLIVASIALTVNLALVLFISRTQIDSHENNLLPNESIEFRESFHVGQISPNLKAAMVHLMGDCFQSCTVLLASILLRFRPTWLWIDPFCTILSSAIILVGSASLMRETIAVLMECSPYDHKKLEKFIEDLLGNGVGGIAKINRLHVWSLGHNRHCLTISITVHHGEHAVRDVKEKCLDFIRREFPLAKDITIQVD